MNKEKKLKIFQTFNNNFEVKYKYLNANPAIKNLFQFQLRLIENKEHAIVDKNLITIIKRNFFFFNFSRIVIYMLSLFIGSLISSKRVFLRSKSASRFFENIFISELKKRKVKTFGMLSYNGSLRSKLNYFFRITWLYDLCERSSEINREILINKCNNHLVLKNLLKSKAFIDRVNVAHKKDLKFLNSIFKNLKLKGILVHTDQTPFAYTFVKAANKLCVNTAVLAHGNFRNPRLISVLPCHAKKIFTWSKQSKELINICNKKKIAEDIEGIKFNIIKRVKNPKNIILVGSPVKDMKFDRKKKLHKIIKILQTISKPGKLIFCKHPSDTYFQVKTILDNFNIIISKNSVYNESKKAKFILGGNSSFLLEAHICGIPTFQLKDLVTNYKMQKIHHIPQYFLKDMIKKKKFSLKKNLQKKNFKYKNNNHISKLINFF